MPKRKLLLADDSVTIQKVVNLTFADEGFEVISVGDGNSAMDKLREESPDLVMVDVNMPGLNGYEICEKVKSSDGNKSIPVILLVGSFEPFDEDEAKRVGADDYLTKPFQSISQLVDSVTQLITKDNDEDMTSTQEFPVEEPAVDYEIETNGNSLESSEFGNDELVEEVTLEEQVDEVVSENLSEYETVEDAEITQEFDTQPITSEGDEGFQIVGAPSADDEVSDFQADSEFSEGFPSEENSAGEVVDLEDDIDISSENEIVESEPEIVDLEDDVDIFSETNTPTMVLDDSNPLELSFIEESNEGESDVIGLVDHEPVLENAEAIDDSEEVSSEDNGFSTISETDEEQPQANENVEEQKDISPEWVNVIVQKVIEAMSDEVIEQVAREVVPLRADSIIKEIVEEKMKD